MSHNKKTTDNSGKQSLSADEIKSLNRRFKQADPDAILKWSWNTFGPAAVMGTGFGPSGIVLIHRLRQLDLKTPVFYLDTHLHFEETYKLRDDLEKRFEISFIHLSTDLSIEDQEQLHGTRLWEKNPDKCCFLRKVLPLQNFLKDKKAWITGVRRDQSASRKSTRVIEWDPANNVIKINPLTHWRSEEIWNYIEENELPYNPLHDFGYPSIGCWPCTSPVNNDSTERAGRWKGSDKIECGIHLPAQKGHNFEL